MFWFSNSLGVCLDVPVNILTPLYILLSSFVHLFFKFYNIILTEDISTAVRDRDIIDLIKENILQDKKREYEYASLLKDYISFLRGETYTKTKLIYSRLNIVVKDELV